MANLNLILLLVDNEWIHVGMLAENKHAFKHSRKLCTLLGIVQNSKFNCVATSYNTYPYLFAQFVAGLILMLVPNFCVIFDMQLTSDISTMDEGSPILSQMVCVTLRKFHIFRLSKVVLSRLSDE